MPFNLNPNLSRYIRAILPRSYSKILKGFYISLAILLLFFFCFVEAAYARGGCFAGETVILTPTGEKAIAPLTKIEIGIL